jgi:hypothetical protein
LAGLKKQGITDHHQQDEILKDFSAEFQSAVERADGVEEEACAGAKDEEKGRRRESVMVLRSEIEKCRRIGLLRSESPRKSN